MTITKKSCTRETSWYDTTRELCKRLARYKKSATECFIFIAWYFFEEVFELLPNRDIQTLEAGGASDN